MTDFCSIDGRLTPPGRRAARRGLSLPTAAHGRLPAVAHGGASVAAARLCEVSVRPSRRVAGRPHRRRNRRTAACQRLSGGRRDRHAAALCRRTYALTADGVSLYRTYALRSLRPCGGGRSLRRLPSRMAHVGTPRNGTVGAAGGRAVRCALCASLRPRRHRPPGRRRAAVRRARRRDLRRAPRRRGVDVGGRSGAAGRHPVGGTTRRRSAASAVRRTLLLRLRGGQLDRLLRRHAPICRSRPNASPRHWRRFPNGRERFRAAAGRFAGRAGRPAFPEK